MFERYTEAARRLIFHARSYASRFGSETIEAEQLLLGVLAEDPTLAARLQTAGGKAASLIEELEADAASRPKIALSMDLPLSQESRRILAYAAEESEALRHRVIDCGHIVLGLLRVENTRAAGFLKQYGIDYGDYRGAVKVILRDQFQPEPTGFQSSIVERAEDWSLQREVAAAPSLSAPIAALKRHIAAALEHVDPFHGDYGEHRLKRKPWTRTEALGHLINLAAVHHVWVARALTEPSITVNGYPPEAWVSAQRYGDYSWQHLLGLWLSANQLLVHILSSVPESKGSTMCRIGIEQPVPLLDVVQRYVDETEDLIGQILSRL